MKLFHVSRLALFVLFVVIAASQLSAQDVDNSMIRRLDEFGPLGNPKQVQQAWQAAREAMKDRPGILVVPATAWSQLKPDALQSLIRIPEAPAPAKTWRQGPGLSVLTSDTQKSILHVPPLSGVGISRDFRMNSGASSPHWGTHPMLTLESKLVYGSVSYLDWLQAPTEAGAAKRFYVPTIRGISPGQFLNVHGGPGYGSGVTRAYVQSLGYDQEKRMHYFVADTDLNHVAGSIAHNKSNTGLIHMTQTSNADNQTYDVKVIRNQYAHGDTYIYYCDFNYMSNIHSAAGDENGNCYAAFVRSLDNNFKGTVEAIDWDDARLTFNGAANVETLGNSRPLINLNPAKSLTAGKVVVVTGRSEFDQPNPVMSTYAGIDYSTGLVKHPITGSTERKFGGLIRGDKDCPWTSDVVGRFFTIDDKSEKTPKGNYRWYLITRFTANDDGTKDIEIERFWWGAKSAGSPTLYNPENYTWDDHVRPLGYIIAPGTYVNDISRAVAGGDRGGQRVLGLAPHSAQGGEFDFAPGDRVEQAIGPDPFKPNVFRSWIWEDVPGQYPASVFEVANNGATSRYAVMWARGGQSNLDDIAKRHEPRPAWDNIVVVDSAATVGLNFKADFAKAAILFQQPYHEQPIKWQYAHPTIQDDDSSKTGITRTIASRATTPKEAVLTVNRTTGEFQFAGGGLQAGGPISGTSGLSGDATPARNLRGKNVSVTAGTTSIDIRFLKAEADGSYAVFIEQSWLTNRAISKKTAEGFTVTFAAAAPESATLDWMMVR